MPKFGVCGIMTDVGIQPVEFSRRVEELGFESLWFGEHAHTPDPERKGQRDPAGFDQLYDAYVTLGAAAAVTKRVRIGISISLVPLYHPIHLAKTIATLDQLSGGRFQFGVGGGYRQQEVEDFGMPFGERWKATREYIQAIRTIWTNDIAEFDGKYVKFGPMRCWPKPAQPSGPPILEGSNSRFTAKRVAEYSNGWLAVDTVAQSEFPIIFSQIRDEIARAGRDESEFEHTMVMRIPIGAPDARQRIDFMLETGFDRIVFLMNRAESGRQHAQLEWFVQLMHLYGG